MALSICPECGKLVQPTDTQCMSCGTNLREAQQKMQRQRQEESLSARTVAAVATGGAAAGGAQAGMAEPTESSEKTRLRIFDQHEAERLVHERMSCWVTAGLVALPGIALLVLGIMRLRVVGLDEIRTLSLADLRNWTVLSDERLLAVVLTGIGLASLLCTIGLIQRAMVAGRAIREVKAGEKPTIVTLTGLTYYGLLLTAIFCPPLGLIIGIALKFSSDDDIKAAAGTMIIVSLVVVGLLVVNGLLALAEGLKSAEPVTLE